MMFARLLLVTEGRSMSVAIQPHASKGITAEHVFNVMKRSTICLG